MFLKLDIGRLRQEDLKFQASLNYIVQCNSVSKEIKPTTKCVSGLLLPLDAPAQWSCKRTPSKMFKSWAWWYL
jgi:hypothetical protein